MTRGRQIAAGAVALSVGQLFVAVAQVLYAAVTSRTFEPASFGAFSVGLAAGGLAGVLCATGLSSFVMAQKHFAAGDVSSVVTLSWASGFVGATAMFVLAPVWAAAWDAEAAIPMTQVLSLQPLLAAPAAVQVALLRREGRVIADATTQAIAAISGLAIGTYFVVQGGGAWALTVSPISAAGMTLLVAYYRRRERYPWTFPARMAATVRFALNVSTQNLGFFLLTSSTMWAVSVGSGQAELGYFSRAALIAGLPATALALVISRSVQPFYRHLETARDKRSAVTDAVIVSCLVVFPLFTGLAVLASPVVALWLGPGWEQAAAMVPPLALGYGTYAVFTVMANAAETMAEFPAIRKSQFAMAPSAIGLAVTVVLTERAIYGAWAILAMSLSGILTLAVTMDRSRLISGKAVGIATLGQGLWAIGIGLAAWSSMSAGTNWWELGPLGQLAAGTAGGALFGLGLLSRQTGWRTLVRRGVFRKVDRA